MSIYLLLTFFVTAATVLNLGSGPYYLFELWAIASVLSASFIRQFDAAWKAMDRPLKMGGAVCILLLTTQSALAIQHPDQLVTRYNPARLHDLHVLASDPSLSVMGKNPELLDPFLSTALEQRHVWNPSGILKEIKGERFDVIFEDRAAPKFSPTILKALSEDYVPL